MGSLRLNEISIFCSGTTINIKLYRYITIFRIALFHSESLSFSGDRLFPGDRSLLNRNINTHQLFLKVIQNLHENDFLHFCYYPSDSAPHHDLFEHLFISPSVTGTTNITDVIFVLLFVRSGSFHERCFVHISFFELHVPCIKRTS